MKQRKLASFLAVTLSLDLMVAPIIPVAKADPEKQAAKLVNTTAEGVAVTLQAVGQIWGQIRQGMNVNQNSMTPQLAGDMNQLKGQQTPQPDKYFNTQKLMQIPGLANYLALNRINPAMLNCSTLPTTLFEARPEVCRVGITNDKGMAPQAQLDQMFTYYNQYFQISKLYSNYKADSNTGGQAFGVGCMNNAMNILNGFFKYRLDELDKLTTNLEAMQDQFKKASRADLDAIEEGTAVLNGQSALADKVRSKKPDLFDFQKRFNNPSCNSMFSGDEINNTGREGGLNQITANLKKTMSTKVGKFSGESYTKNHASVLEDLEGLADKVSKQLELNFSTLSKDPASYGRFLQDLPDLVSSPNGANRALSADLFSDVRTKFNDSFLKLNEQKSTVLSELRGAGVAGEAATSLLGNAASNNFESEVIGIENKLKNKCFQDTLSEMDVDKIMNKIYDPSASAHANQYASNFVKDKLSKILNDKDSSLEKKLSELQALEGQNKGRYYLKMENSYEVQDVDQNGNLKTEVVSATNIRTPTVFFSDLIKNCNAQFKANKLDNKMSGASAIQKLRELNQQYKALAKSQAASMKKEVRRKLIECTSPEEANNSNPGSCTPDRFNISAPGFCANAAFSCSKNMQACFQQAETYTKEIKDQRAARVTNYKALVEKNKNDVIKMFDTALASYMKDGEMLRGMFGAGFSSPSGIQREVPEGEKYLAEFAQATSRSIDGELLLEDPAAYVKMFKQNIALLKESVKKQQDQILGGDATGMGKSTPGLLGQHIQKTEKAYQDVIAKADKQAGDCLSKHDSALAAAEQQRARQQEEQAKKMSELGEKRNEFCSRLDMLAEDPDGACDSLGSLSRDVLGSLNTPEARNTAGQFSAYCRSRNSGNTSNEINQPSIQDYAKACDWAGWEYDDEANKITITDDKSRVRKLCALVRKECSSPSPTTTTPGSTPGTTITTGTSCGNDLKQSAILKWSQNQTAERQVGSAHTPIGLDAGSACGAANNSTNRWAKAIETIGSATSQAIGASSK